MTTNGFSDSNISARVRDAVEKIARSVVREEGVTYRYGTVTAIDYDNGIVDVQFAGAAISVPVRSLGIQPTQVGQVVQVASRKGDHFVNGVVGASGIVSTGGTGLAAPVLTLKDYTESVVGDWNNIAGASAYEFEVAKDDAFTVDSFVYQTSASQYTFPSDEFGTGYYARVRALDGSTPPQAGAWSNTAGPIAPAEGGGSGATGDGSAPTDSPDVTLVSGIGYLQARWTEDDANPDPVAYEVHISTSSGFSPSGLTFYDVTGGNTLFIRTEADGSPLQYDTNYYVRLLAFDIDGKALNAGAQAIAQIDRVETADAGQIGIGNIGDGAVPSSSPAVKDITAGIGYLFVTWDHVANVDPVQYEVHVSTTNNFSPNSNTRVGDTPSNFFFIRQQGPGAGGAPLVYATTYYVKIISYDVDGYAASFGAQGSGSSLRAISDDLDTNSVTTVKIVDSAIAAAKLQTNSVTNVKILNSAVDGNKIANGAVSTAKIVDNAVNNAKIGPNAVDTAEIVDNAIKEAKLGANAVTSTKIFDAAITEAKIATDAVTNLKIAPNAVDTAQIVNDAINNAKIGPNAVDTAELVDDAITNAKIGPNAVNTAELVDGAINSAKLANAAVQTAKIADGAVDTTQIANAAITNALIDNSAVSSANIQDAAITNAKIDNLAVTNAKIDNLAVDAAKIGDLAVTTAKIDNAAITNAKIDNLAVDAAKITDLAVTTAKIDNAAITNAKIGLLAVDEANIQDAAITNAKIGALAVDTANIQTAAITTALIENAAITNAKIGLLAVDTANIAAAAIETAKIDNAAITNAKIANLAVDAAKITDLAVTTAKIDNAAITNAKIGLLAVDEAQIADAAITNAKIGALAVDTANIQAAAITTALIENAAITNAKIGALAVDSANIVDAAITNAKIGTAAIATANIQTAAITNATIADLAVDTAKIAAASITTALIADAQISTAKIQDLAVSDAKINTLTASKITAGTIASELITISGTLGRIRSSNYVAGSSGWQVDGAGDAEFNNIEIRGSGVFGPANSDHLEIAVDGSGNLQKPDNMIYYDSALKPRVQLGKIYNSISPHGFQNYGLAFYYANGTTQQCIIDPDLGQLTLFRESNQSIKFRISDTNSDYINLTTSTGTNEIRLDPDANFANFDVNVVMGEDVTVGGVLYWPVAGGGNLYRNFESANHLYTQVFTGSWTNRLIVLSDGATGFYNNDGTLTHHAQADGDFSLIGNISLGNNHFIGTSTNNIYFQRDDPTKADTIWIAANDFIRFSRNDYADARYLYDVKTGQHRADGSGDPRWSFIDDTTSGLSRRSAGGGGCFLTGKGEQFIAVTDFFGPAISSGANLGNDSLPWASIRYTGTIQDISDRKAKEDIEDDDLGLQFIKRLRPRKYKKKSYKGNSRFHGLVAQEVKEVLDEFGASDFAGYEEPDKSLMEDFPEGDPSLMDMARLGYTEFIGPIIKALQELDARIDAIDKGKDK